MIRLGFPYTKEWEGRPEGMSRFDTLIWNDSKDHLVNDLTTIYYNARIGPEPPIYEKRLNPFRMMWWKLCCRKVDVILITPEKTTLIEVRHEANEAAIGRLLLYRDLWKKHSLEKIAPEALLITDLHSDQIEGQAMLNNIHYISPITKIRKKELSKNGAIR